jgi:hypothetical protein
MTGPTQIAILAARRSGDRAYRNRLTFLLYPQAPRGVVLNGYIVGGPAVGTLPEAFLERLRAEMGRSPGNDPD